MPDRNQRAGRILAFRALGAGAVLVPLLLSMAVVTSGTGAVVLPRPAAAPVVSGVSGVSLSSGPAAGGTSVATPIRHIVVLMQENHTFDSELGYWCDQNPGRCTGMPATVTLADKTVVTPGITPDTVPNIDHSVTSQTMALHDKWGMIIGCDAGAGYACISGYTPNAVPNLAALAGRYTILDHAFTLANSPSFGGHLDEFAATTDGFTGDLPVHDATQPTGPFDWGCDSYAVAKYVSPKGKVSKQPACIPDYSLNRSQYPYGGAYERTLVSGNVTTIMQEMDSAGVSWKIYSARPDSPGGAIWAGCPLFASCLYTSELGNVTGSPQRFFTAAAAGTLPDVSFIAPDGSALINGQPFYYGAYSQHNGQSNAAGDNFIGQVASALARSPEWSSTALLITWDDCGCFYDQVQPPVAPDGRQMGFRVPFIIVSPYALPSHTDSTPTSSTGGILAFIEANFGLPALGVNDAGADNLMGDFGFSQQPSAMPRMTSQPLPASAYRLSPSTAKEPT